MNDVMITTSSSLTEEEFLEEATKTDKDEAEDIEDDEELVAPTTRTVENPLKISKHLDKLIKCFLEAPLGIFAFV